MRLAVVVPVYNHGRTAREVVRAAAALGWPVWVVDDGSTDGGVDGIEALPQVRLLRHPVNRGKGAALLTGFRAAAEHADWAVTLDADGQHDPADIPRLIAAIPAGQRPIVVGQRRQMASEGAPWTSRFGRGFSNFWVRAAGGPRVLDSQSGLRIYPLPEVLALELRARRYQFEVEVLVKAAWAGLPAIETPVSVRYFGAERISHFRPFVDFCRNSDTFARLIVRRVFRGVPRLFYRLLAAASRVFGAWLFGVAARVVAAGYFVLFPRRAAVSAAFYRALFPGRGRWHAWWCAWRQFQTFTTVYLDRLLLESGDAIRFTFEGREHLYASLAEGRGGILLMSHLGAWEMGARLLRRSLPELRLMLYVGRRAKEDIERLQKEDLAASGVRLQVVGEDGGSPFDLVEGAAFLRSGGFVSMAGDLDWREDREGLPVRFAGHEVRLPEAPFMLALVARAPLYVFFAARRAPRQYHFALRGPLPLPAASRERRREVVREAAQAYADLLEAEVRSRPLEWFHFSRFLGPPLAAPPADPPPGARIRPA
ncbi:MAG TPA: glycosyltransferase [bacterium]